LPDCHASPHLLLIHFPLAFSAPLKVLYQQRPIILDPFHCFRSERNFPMPSPTNSGKQLQTLSRASLVDIARNLGHRVAEDNSLDAGLLELINAIAINTAVIGLTPQVTVIRTSSAAVTYSLILKCPASARILVFDIFCSVNGATNLSFINKAGTAVLPTFYASAAGQGFVCNSMRGFWLPRGSSLFYSSSAAVAHNLVVSASVITDQA